MLLIVLAVVPLLLCNGKQELKKENQEFIGSSKSFPYKNGKTIPKEYRGTVRSITKE